MILKNDWSDKKRPIFRKDRLEILSSLLDNLENTNDYPNNLTFLLKSIDYSKFKFSTKINKYFGGGMIEWITANNLKLSKEYNYHPSTEQNKLFFKNFIQPIF